MHSIIAQPVMADAAALDGAGGGYIGGLFERLLFFGLGFGARDHCFDGLALDRVDHDIGYHHPGFVSSGLGQRLFNSNLW